jgi:phosphatidylethanolamine/phosphatidyl-N-methylethanolamine N-methyltransferase
VSARPGPEQGASSSFLKAFFTARSTIGAVRATNRGVARHMARLGGVASARAVAELGPGTGAITRELLAALPETGRLIGFEIYEPFLQHLAETVHDPRFEVRQQSAETIAEVARQEIEGGFDAVISSVPFSLMGADLTRSILHAVGESLRPGGVFVALQYHPRYLPPFLSEEFADVRREIHLLNLPPVLLFHARNPRFR